MPKIQSSCFKPNLQVIISSTVLDEFLFHLECFVRSEASQYVNLSHATFDWKRGKWWKNVNTTALEWLSPSHKFSCKSIPAVLVQEFFFFFSWLLFTVCLSCSWRFRADPGIPGFNFFPRTSPDLLMSWTAWSLQMVSLCCWFVFCSWTFLYSHFMSYY